MFVFKLCSLNKWIPIEKRSNFLESTAISPLHFTYLTKQPRCKFFFSLDVNGCRYVLVSVIWFSRLRMSSFLLLCWAMLRDFVSNSNSVFDLLAEHCYLIVWVIVGVFSNICNLSKNYTCIFAIVVLGANFLVASMDLNENYSSFFSL